MQRTAELSVQTQQEYPVLFPAHEVHRLQLQVLHWKSCAHGPGEVPETKFPSWSNSWCIRSSLPIFHRGKYSILISYRSLAAAALDISLPNLNTGNASACVKELHSKGLFVLQLTNLTWEMQYALTDGRHYSIAAVPYWRPDLSCRFCTREFANLIFCARDWNTELCFHCNCMSNSQQTDIDHRWTLKLV